MESASLHDQHQLQQHFIGCSSLPSQSAYGVSITHDCNSSFILNESDYNIHVNEILPNSRELWPKSTTSIIEPHVKTSMIQDLRFHGARSNSFTHQSANELHFAKIKEGMSNSFPKFSPDVVYGASNAEELHLPSSSYNKHEQECCHDLLLSNFSLGHQITGLQCSAGELFSNNAQNNSACFGGITSPRRSNFSHAFLSTNISDQDLSSSLVSSSLGLNLQASDLLNSIDYGGSLGDGHGQSFQDNIGLYTQSMSLGHDQMQESSNSTQSTSSKKTSVFMKGVARTRPSFPEPKAHHAAAKKPRLGSQSSYSPLKVRKEKVGDRIAALQRLVSPFGKTDTASVLTEAIGYIQFLQDQIQTLSVPYMNSSGSKPLKTMKVEMGSKRKEDGKEEAKQDLRSRGLCLVPITFTSYITNYSNGRIGGDHQS